MTLSCIIVDDEPLARNLLSQYVAKVPFLRLQAVCTGPMEAVEILRENPPDILFLDVQMPEITGIGLLKILTKKPYVILTTAYSEYALEGYELDVMDYLLKPITFERFFKAVEKAASRLRPAAETPPAGETPTEPAEKAETTNPYPAYMFVKDGTSLVKVRVADIRYVEGLKDYVAIHVADKKIVTLQRMKNLETQLPPDQFIRVHHSYIVAFEWIDAIHKERVQIGKTMIPISDSYQKAFRAAIAAKTNI